MASIKDVIVKKPTDEEREKCLQWPTWSSEVCKFNWEYTETETCLIIEGRVDVYDPEEKECVSFGAGDLVVFPNGLSCIWDVKEAVLKHYNFG